MAYDTIASHEAVNKTAEALKKNGFSVIVAKDGSDAKAHVFKLIPKGAEVMPMTSVTLDTLGISKEINESGHYKSARSKLYDKETPPKEKKKLGCIPDYTIGSVHAVTQEGHLLIASNTGSQLPAYAYGAEKVVWVVGTQKIVKDTNDGLKRIYEHSLPLESERAKKAYGVAGSSVNKILIVNREIVPGRITVVLVPEVLGF
ncbi:MAG TPA: LUD domain-containing protein [Candidatus Binatia bacterium]|nr:LUD domain-containing protein [Candidatus Binatia bacterium]